MNHDTLTSFEPICLLASSPTVIVVNGNSPYRTLADLVGAARAKPGELTPASINTFRIAFEMLQRTANVKMTLIPYPGNAPAISAHLGDHVTSVLAVDPRKRVGDDPEKRLYDKPGRLMRPARCVQVALAVE